MIKIAIKVIPVLLLIFASSVLKSQVNTGSNKIYLVYFKDKNNTPYSITKPSEFLSQRAISRRNKNDIKISSNDFPVNPHYLDSLRSKGAQILFSSRWLNTATIKVDTSLVITKIETLPFVVSTEKVFSGDVTDTLFYEETNFKHLQSNTDYGYGYRQINMLNGDFLHNKGYSGQGVIIAVLDAGFWNVNNLSLFSSMFADNRVIKTYNFMKGNDSVYVDHTHGTYVLSVMAANTPGKLVGTAPKAQYMLIVSENGSSEFIIEEDAWIAAAEMADSSGADVINSSLGYTTYDNPLTNHSYQSMDGKSSRISRAATIAASKGIIVVNSAGNQGNKEWKYISAPADADSILAIGAVNMERQYAKFSSQGPSYDGRIKPNVTAMGEATVTTGLKEGELASISGTSLSSPVIAGLVACLVQAFPNRKNMEIIRAIEQSAHLFPKYDQYYGYGIPDFKVAYEILDYTNKEVEENFKIVKTYPNPFNKAIVVSYYTKDSIKLLFSLTDLAGRKVIEKEITTQHNTLDRIELKINDILRPGFYILSISDGKTKITEPLLSY